MKKLLFLALILINFAAKAEITQWRDIASNFDAGKIRLLSTAAPDQEGGRELLLGVEFKLKKGWKIYGRDSSGIGLAPSIEFLGYQKFLSYKISWPKSITQEEKIGDETLKYSIYKGHIILPIATKFKADSDFDLKINFGICKDICIPASAEFSIFTQDLVDLEALKIIKSQQNPSKSPKTAKITLISALIAAFIGGFILNFMPCVLPVLGIKIISMLNHAKASKTSIRQAFLATILGIFACFALFSLFAISISASAGIFNWGVQFQNPYFIIFLIIILLFFAANMMGLFEVSFSQIITNSINKKAQKSNNIFISNFLSGILAVLLSTPCSAPFLGTAISFSVTQSYYNIVLIFAFIAFGLAFPYFILLIWPKSVYFLPKSGKWTQKIKNIMAVFLILTIFWLLYVLLGNIGAKASFLVAFLAFLIFLAFAITNKSLKFVAIFILLSLLSFFPMQMQEEPAKTPQNTIWQPFDEQKIPQLINDGKIVVIDVTANWCITCKFNKYRVLESEIIKKRLAQNDIVAMRADITKKNPEIMAFINKYDRYAIPFNAVFGASAPEGLVASELLSKEELLRLIDEASSGSY